MTKAKAQNYVDIAELLPYKKLTQVPANIHSMQAQIRALFAKVLYPKDVCDIIDYFLRECVKREQPIRVCKNCGRYFAIAGRISAAYCDRLIDSKGHTCKSMGSINQWSEKAREEKTKCDNGEIKLREFEVWLRKS